MMSPPSAPRVQLGTAPLGGLYADVPSATAHATVEAAWALGIRSFDTAPLYGSGLAEQRLGEALAGRPRGEYTVSTKVGRLLQPGKPSPHFVGAPALEPVLDFSPEGVRRSLAESLERLQLDRIDIALLHDPEGHMDEARRALETVRELAPLVGVGTNVVETALALVDRAEVDVVLLAGRYTLLDRSAANELLPLCVERGVPLIAAGVFNTACWPAARRSTTRPPHPSSSLGDAGSRRSARATTYRFWRQRSSSRSGTRASPPSSSAPARPRRSPTTSDSSIFRCPTTSGRSSRTTADLTEPKCDESPAAGT